jgi:transcriptional regulator EpsA
MGSALAPERLASHDAIIPLLDAALSARSQLGWSQWLQGEMQSVLPHYGLIAAWGDFRAGELEYDVITRSPALALNALPHNVVEPLMQTLFAHWLAAGQEPVALDARSLGNVGTELLASSPCVLVHGMQDHRSRFDCLYVFVGPAALGGALSRNLVRMALPYIDTAFRQLGDRGQKAAQHEMSETGFCCSSFADCADASATRGLDVTVHGDPVWGEGPAGERGAELSARELEVMQWVRMGKTNPEIAIILNLSTFTVKNHMRRIYRKLDVLNRAQAVGCLDRMRPSVSVRHTESSAR